MFDVGEEPKRPIKFMSTKVGSLWQDFVYQTNLKFFGNTPAMAFNDNLNNTKVCSAINSLPVSCFVTRIKESQQTESKQNISAQQLYTLQKYCNQRAKLSEELLFVADFSLLFLIK